MVVGCEEPASLAVGAAMSAAGSGASGFGSGFIEPMGKNGRAADLELSDEVVQRLSRVTDAVKTHVGSNADPWEAVSRMEQKR